MMNATQKRFTAGGMLALAMITGYWAWRLGQHSGDPVPADDIAGPSSTVDPNLPGPFVPPERSILRITPDLPTVSHVPASAGDLSDCNLLLVTLDTTRADRIGCYGNDDIETPTLDRLAKEGLVFSDVMAVAPETLPSHASILTGLYPTRHGAHANGLFRLNERHHTLAERLSEEGFRTGAVVSAFVLNAQAGLAQGFEHYDDDLSGGTTAAAQHFPERTANRTTARALAWMDQVKGERFFLWVHYFDPHHVYSPPTPFAEEYEDNPYDGEIAFVDSALGDLLDGLAAADLDSRTLVAVVGDHGEGLGQHAEITHPYLVYDTTLRVPMILRAGDRLGDGTHCTLPTSQVDVAPMLLSLLGLEFGQATDAQDTLAPAPEQQPRFFQTMAGALEFGWEPLTGVCLGDYKYIHSSVPELYQRIEDPGELKNLATSEPDVTAQLHGLLMGAFGDVLTVAPTPTVQPTMAELEQLQALGYLEAGSGGTDGSAKTQRPQIMMPVLHRVAVANHDSKPEAQRIAELNELVQEYPDFYPAWKALGTAYRRAKSLDEAAIALGRCLELRPDTPQTVFELALVRMVQSRHEETRELLEPVVEAYPGYTRARYLYGSALRRLNRNEEAIVQFEAVLDVDPNYPQGAQRIVDSYKAVGRPEQVPAILEGYLTTSPRATSTRVALAEVYEAQGDNERADELLQQGMLANPDDADLVKFLVVRHAKHPDPERRNPQAAIDVLVAFIDRRDPPEVAALITLSDLYAHIGNFDDAIASVERAREFAFAEGGPSLLASTERQLAGLEARAESAD